jgi:hypothetical protein
MRQMREHGTPGHKALLRRGFAARPSVQLPTGSSGSRGYREGKGKSKPRPHPLRLCPGCGLDGARSVPKIDSNSLDGNQACCQFSSTVAAPQQPNQSAPAIPIMQAKTGGRKEAAMRVRVTTDGRLLGLDIGDWWTLIAGSTLAGLLAFFM